MSPRTPSAGAALPTAGRSASLLLALTASALAIGLAAAAPAAAVEDPSKPDARVTHGPSCHPGGVVVEVTGGTVGYTVTLATTRAPQGEDSAEVLPGGTVVLRTGEVDWAETIDGRLEYTALDGSRTSYVDELDGYTFTRPAEEDCAAITVPAAAATVPPVLPGQEAAEVPGADGIRPDGTGAPVGTGTAGPGKVIVPGTAASVEPVGASATPAALAPTSLPPMLVATVALGAAAAALVGELGRVRRVRRRSTGSG